MAFFDLGVAQLIFWLVVLVTGIISAIQVWHWHAYGLKSPVVAFVEILYLVGTLLLLGVAFTELNLLT